MRSDTDQSPALSGLDQLDQEALRFAAGEVTKLQEGLAALGRPNFVTAMAAAAAAVVSSRDAKRCWQTSRW